MCFPGELGFPFCFSAHYCPFTLVPHPLSLMKHLDRGQETIYNHPKVASNKHSQSSQPLLWLPMKSAASSLQDLKDGGSLSAQLLLEPLWQKPRQLWAMGGSCFNVLHVQAEQSDMRRKDVGNSSRCYFSPRQPLVDTACTHVCVGWGEGVCVCV